MYFLFSKKRAGAEMKGGKEVGELKEQKKVMRVFSG